MGMLEKLKSLLGLGNGREPPGRGEARDRETGPVTTVEREPSTASEDAVKGTETRQAPGETATTAGGGTAEATTTEAATNEAAPSEAEAVASDSASESEPAGSGESTETITGIGPAYAERLEGAGIATVADLAGADAERLAEETDLSEKRIQGWIEQAQDR